MTLALKLLALADASPVEGTTLPLADVDVADGLDSTPETALPEPTLTADDVVGVDSELEL